MSAGKQLTDCPSNLKEAIDWILRVTVKDGGGGQNGTTELADAVTQLLGDVKSSTPELHNKFDEIKGALWSGGSNGLLDNLATGLAKFIGYENGKKPDGTIGIVKSGYTSSYPDSSNWNKDFGHNPNHSTAAKIFMGCVPMIFSALSYLYWRCDNEGGGWQDQYFSGTYGIQTDLKDFVVSMGFRFSELNGSQGKTVMATVAKTFQDLSSVSDRISYPAFLKTVREKPSALQPNLQQYPLASLYLLASTYFTHKQSKADSPPTGSPKSIREMLYFLAALPFSPSYDSFSEHISSIFRMLSPKSSDNDAELKLPVAISGSPNKGDYLNPDKMRDYLINTCFFCSIVLGRLQGHSASTSDEPWLHSLYCNSMNLRYPSGSALFNTVANYSYALQFQLSFLHQQCMSGSVNCGWLQCKYGKNVPAHTASPDPLQKLQRCRLPT
ncbi:variant erythrocyte surface antigen-1 family protein [Babesia caballi]|uniref:Variant erythrocyte surface antigen-1 family protein n=1 Tax=Babesia caballi TaxID=5871 RepID=A0AAV4LXX5_BABCB|nr:variant erythrocyte surface antigen-1 family protein [Babesia caballi]